MRPGPGRVGGGRAVLLAVPLLGLPAPLGAVELSGRFEIEARGFTHPPAHSGQRRHGLSLAVQPELYHAFDDGRRSLLFTPFLRVDTADEERTHFDVRELLYQRVFDSAELRAGIGRVFWGVTESYHLVDVVNQTDLVENVDRDDKLGQPLVILTLIRDWGALDLFVLPGFRERDLSGAGRAPALRALRRYRSGHLRVRGRAAAYRLRGAVVPCDRGFRRRRGAFPRHEPGAAAPAPGGLRRRQAGARIRMPSGRGGARAPLRGRASHLAGSASHPRRHAVEARSAA